MKSQSLESKKFQPKFDVIEKVAPVIAGFGKFYNGFEAVGVEKIPRDRPALLVFYHGLLPLDAWYFGLQFYLETGILIRAMGDRFLFKTPGLSWLCRAVGGVPGNPETALKFLNDGHLVGVSPGGVREAISGTKNNYKLIWNNRYGFARVALQAKVDIIPIFTENIDEIYRAPFADRAFFQNLYEKTRLPLVPIIGLGILPFPVKLRTWVGDPIPYDPNDTPESLRERTRVAIEKLIYEHQPKISSVPRALLRRAAQLKAQSKK